MKKILSILIIIAIVLQAVLSIEGTKQDNIHSWNMMGNDGTALKINLFGDREFIFNNITILSSKYNVNFMKNTTIWTSNQDFILIKSIYLSHDFEYQFNFINGIMLSKDDNHTNKYLATNNSEDKDQMGQLDIPLLQPAMEIWTLNKLKNSQYPMDGTYYVQVGNFQDSKAFIEECSKLFMTDQSVLLSNNSNDLTQNSMSILKLLNIVVYLLIIIILIYYYFNHVKIMFILKVNGYSTWKVYWHLNKWFLILESVCMMLTVIFLRFILENPNGIFMKNLISQLFVLLGVTLLGSLVSIFLLKSLNIVEFIKGKNFQHILIGFNFVFKFITLAFLVVALSLCLANLSQSVQIMEYRKAWKPYDDYAVLDYYDSVHYMESQQANQIQSIEEYYLKMEKEGAVYAQYDIHNNSMKINSNYLEKLNLKDQNGEKIVIPSDSKDRIYLLPLSEINNEEAIISNMMSEQEAIYSVLYYDNTINNLFFTMDTRAVNPYCSNVVFDIVTKDNMNWLEKKNITSTGINSPLKIDTNVMNIDTINELAFQYLNSEFGRPTYHTVRDVFTNDDMMILTIYKTTIPALIIALIIYLFITYQTVLIYVEANLKNLTIKKLHGFSLKKRYQHFFKVQSIINIVILITFIILCLSFMNSTANNLYINIKPKYNYLFVGGILVMIDFIITGKCIQNIETKRLAQFIKGENYGNH